MFSHEPKKTEKTNTITNRMTSTSMHCAYLLCLIRVALNGVGLVPAKRLWSTEYRQQTGLDWLTAGIYAGSDRVDFCYLAPL